MKKIFSTMLCLSLIGCMRHETPPAIYSGQAFVTLKNGETIKLSGITISVIESNSAAVSIEKLQREIAPAIAKIKKEYADIGEQITKAQNEIEVSKSGIEHLIAEEDILRSKRASAIAKAESVGSIQQKKYLAEIEQIDTKLEVMHQKITALDIRFRQIPDEIQQLEKKRENIYIPDEKEIAFSKIFETHWEKPLLMQSTDADGRFKLAIPETGTNYAIFAQAKRMVGNYYESYGWIVNLNPGETNIFLNVNNMTASK